MKTNEMLAVMDREQQLLTDDNWHASAAVIGEAAELLREHRAVMRQVEAWWVEEGQHKFGSAPGCMFALREILEK